MNCAFLCRRVHEVRAREGERVRRVCYAQEQQEQRLATWPAAHPACAACCLARVPGGAAAAWCPSPSACCLAPFLQIAGGGMMSIILAGALWFVLLPTAAELCGLSAVHSALLGLQVGGRE